MKLAASFDRALPPAWEFDTMVVLRSVERVLSQWVRAQFVLGFAVGLFTFIGLLVLSRFVDPIFGRYALLLSVTAGILELLPIIGPIISAVPAVLLAATAGPEAVIAALVLYTLVQQIENNFLVPKIQGDATELHPGGRDVRDHHRRRTRRPGRRDPRVAGRGGGSRCRAVPLPTCRTRRRSGLPRTIIERVGMAPKSGGGVGRSRRSARASGDVGVADA